MNTVRANGIITLRNTNLYVNKSYIICSNMIWPLKSNYRAKFYTKFEIVYFNIAYTEEGKETNCFLEYGDEESMWA
jgi:hypothetical protein